MYYGERVADWLTAVDTRRNRVVRALERILSPIETTDETAQIKEKRREKAEYYENKNSQCISLKDDPANVLKKVTEKINLVRKEEETTPPWKKAEEEDREKKQKIEVENKLQQEERQQ